MEKSDVWNWAMSETEQFIPLDEVNDDEQGSSEHKKHEKVAVTANLSVPFNHIDIYLYPII